MIAICPDRDEEGQRILSLKEQKRIETLITAVSSINRCKSNTLFRVESCDSKNDFASAIIPIGSLQKILERRDRDVFLPEKFS